MGLGTKRPKDVPGNDHDCETGEDKDESEEGDGRARGEVDRTGGESGRGRLRAGELARGEPGGPGRRIEVDVSELERW